MITDAASSRDSLDTLDSQGDIQGAAAHENKGSVGLIFLEHDSVFAWHTCRCWVTLTRSVAASHTCCSQSYESSDHLWQSDNSYGSFELCQPAGVFVRNSWFWENFETLSWSAVAPRPLLAFDLKKTTVTWLKGLWSDSFITNLILPWSISFFSSVSLVVVHSEWAWVPQ